MYLTGRRIRRLVRLSPEYFSEHQKRSVIGPIWSQVRLIAPFKRNCPLCAGGTFIYTLIAKLGDLRAGCALRRLYTRKGQEFLKSSARFAGLESAFLEANSYSTCRDFDRPIK